MTLNSLLKYFVVLFITALVGCSPLTQGRDLGSPASIADAPVSAPVSQGEGLKVVIIPLKQSVELGEPVYLALRVTNVQDRPITIIGNLRPGEGLVEIYSTGSKEEKVILSPLIKGDFGGKTVLVPGQTIGDVFPIFFGANGWSFREPGEYRLMAKVKVPAKGGFSVFNSGTVVLKVLSSKAGKALFSTDDRISIEAGKFLLWRSGDHLKSGIEHLTKLSKEYSDSALSVYITSALVRSYSEPFANYIERKVRVPDCKKADSLRQKIKGGVLVENILIEDYISQAKCNAESKNWNGAIKALDAGFKLTAERPEFGDYSRSIEEMKKRLGKFVR